MVIRERSLNAKVDQPFDNYYAYFCTYASEPSLNAYWDGNLSFPTISRYPRYKSLSWPTTSIPRHHRVSNKATRNSRSEFTGICHHKIPDGNSREFLHIASLIFFLLECNLSDPGFFLELLQYRTSYYAALLPGRGPHIASNSVCPSVCPSVPLSLPLVTSFRPR